MDRNTKEQTKEIISTLFRLALIGGAAYGIGCIIHNQNEILSELSALTSAGDVPADAPVILSESALKELLQTSIVE